jgi:hypothetical protein
MAVEEANESVRVLAHSPGKYPILVIELPSGELCTAYFETDYDLGRAKPVEKDWLMENAIGRHSFVEVTPPAQTSAASLADYVRNELL